jgi:hypothetical protein
VLVSLLRLHSPSHELLQTNSQNHLARPTSYVPHSNRILSHNPTLTYNAYSVPFFISKPHFLLPSYFASKALALTHQLFQSVKNPGCTMHSLSVNCLLLVSA